MKWPQRPEYKEVIIIYQNIPTKVLTGEVRLSYAALTAARAVKPGDEPKYSVTILIPKTDTATKANIDASIEYAAADAQGKIWGGVRPPIMPIPVHDGDGVRDNGTPYGPECKGCWVITASSKNKPQVVHQSDIRTELAPQDIYSGMYARVTINFFGYENRGKRGVGCGLGNVMKTREGEPLSGGASADVDFAEVGAVIPGPAAGYAPPAQNYAPQSYTAPSAGGYAPQSYAPNYMPQNNTPPWETPNAIPYAGQQRINPLTGLPYSA